MLRGIYYQLKPLLPWHFRVALRRSRAQRQRREVGESWPISHAAAQPPRGWIGWPDGKEFALVLTHDVEGKAGLPKCAALVRLEQEFGFRSGFYFVPEGDYTVPDQFRAELIENGLEVGVHDLRHNGKLYWSRWGFRRHARRINRYLREWNAVGFRSAFMLHRLDWLHDLDILYDASTFDTDPFEPQPEGVHTVFPFWVAGLDGEGYVELPYTLAQDFTVFTILEERGPAIWKRKLDWIAEHGGMALLNTHPDYMSFTDSEDARTYPVSFYRQLLEYASSRYGGRFWQPLPKELAAFARSTFEVAPGQPVAARTTTASLS
jgi:hypothetical protein